MQRAKAQKPLYIKACGVLRCGKKVKKISNKVLTYRSQYVIISEHAVEVGAIMPGNKTKACMICVDAGGGRSSKREISAEYVRF